MYDHSWLPVQGPYREHPLSRIPIQPSAFFPCDGSLFFHWRAPLGILKRYLGTEVCELPSINWSCGAIVAITIDLLATANRTDIILNLWRDINTPKGTWSSSCLKRINVVSPPRYPQQSKLSMRSLSLSLIASVFPFFWLVHVLTCFALQWAQLYMNRNELNPNPLTEPN